MEERLRSPNRDDYVGKGSSRRPHPIDFNRIILEHPSIYQKDLAFVLKGQVVVDLGAGDKTTSYLLAEMAEAAAYVAVEPYFYKELAIEFQTLMSDPKLKKDLPFTIVPEDMLTLLERLPESSVSVMAFGIDYTVIEMEYTLRVSQEVQRVLHPEGALVSSNIGKVIKPNTAQHDEVLSLGIFRNTTQPLPFNPKT